MSTLLPPPFQNPYQHQHAFYPSTPSPLSPLPANVCRPNLAQAMSHHTSSPTLAKRPGLFTSSRIQPRPSLARRDPKQEREKRRVEFLRGVRERGEERRFSARNEQLQRLDALAERKAWEEERERLAVEWSLEYPNEDEDEDAELEMDQSVLLEELASLEDQEFEEMVSSMQMTGQDAAMEQDMGPFGSDDEEYDKLMVEAVLEVEEWGCAVGVNQEEREGEMDIEMG